jgi:hypothetical protein
VSSEDAFKRLAMFIESIRKEVDTIHNVTRQINIGMQPRTKRSKTRIVERRIDELYDRFQHNRITERDLLRGLSLSLLCEK